MLNYRNKIITLSLLLGVLYAGFVSAQYIQGRFYYVYLYYTGERVILDKDHISAFEVVSIDQNIADNKDYGDDQDIIGGKSPSGYSWSIASQDNKILEMSSFDPIEFIYQVEGQSGSGKLKIAIPYYNEATIINFYGPNGQNIAINIKENIPVSVQPSPSMTPPVARSKWKIFLPLVIWFGLAIGVGAIWFVIKKRRTTY